MIFTRCCNSATSPASVQLVWVHTRKLVWYRLLGQQQASNLCRQKHGVNFGASNTTKTCQSPHSTLHRLAVTAAMHPPLCCKGAGTRRCYFLPHLSSDMGLSVPVIPQGFGGFQVASASLWCHMNSSQHLQIIWRSLSADNTQSSCLQYMLSM